MYIKFYTYTNELNEIINILNEFPPIHNVSSKELQKYKELISRKEFLQKKINTLLNKRANIIGKYNDKNRVWLATNMNCRKYYKLEQSAAYSRDSALYKIGFLDLKPVPPLVKNLKNSLNENLYQPLYHKFSNLKVKLNSKLKLVSQKSPIYQSFKKSKNFIKNDLPISITNFAISGAKKCIVSYRNFSNSYSRKISTSKSIKTLSYIMKQAKEQADLQQQSFISRIKVNPNTYQYCNNSATENVSYGTGIPVIQSNSRNPVILQKSRQRNNPNTPNFDLAL